MSVSKFFRTRLASAFALLILALSACTEQAVETPKPPAQSNDGKQRFTILTDSLEQVLLEDELTWELWAIRDSMTASFKALGSSPDSLEAAYLANDHTKIRQLIGYNASKLTAVDDRLQQISDTLLMRYPELAAMMGDVETCMSNQCGATFAAGFATYTKGPSGALMRTIQAGGGQNTCNYALLTVAAAACSVGGPIWYWPCVYLAVCEYCTGPTYDDMCFR